MKKISIVHGSNLNILELREKEIYGGKSLKNINQLLNIEAKKLNILLDIFQSNSEEKIIYYIQKKINKSDIMIINPGGFTYYSVSILDSLIASNINFIEVHISNIFSRENFRKNSIFSSKALGVITGFKEYSYIHALHLAKQYI